MSALGHERRFGRAPTMSQLPLIADIKTDIGRSKRARSRHVSRE